MFTVDSTAAGELKTYVFPPGTSGPVLIQVQDSQSVQGEPQDSLFVDYLVITSYTRGGYTSIRPVEHDGQRRHFLGSVTAVHR